MLLKMMPLQWQRRQSIGAVDYGTRGMGMCADPGSYRWCHQALSRSRTSFATSTTEDCCYQIRYNTDTAIASGTEVVAIPKCPFGEQRFQPLSIVNASATSNSSGKLAPAELPARAKASHLHPAIVIRRSSLQILFSLLLAATLLPKVAEANNHHNHNSNNIPGKHISINYIPSNSHQVNEPNVPLIENVPLKIFKSKHFITINCQWNVRVDECGRHTDKCWLYSITS